MAERDLSHPPASAEAPDRAPPGEGLRLLIIDDDVRLTEAMARYLRRGGYAVEAAHAGEEGLLRYQAFAPHLVVLDLMMPGMDGLEVCRRLRESSSTPIIMLTARDSEIDRVMGLRLGADDYVGKPFSLKELEARVEAVLRRSRGSASSGEPPGAYDDGFLFLDPVSLEVRREGQALKLAATERRLIFTLFQHRDRVLGAEHILQLVWGREYADQQDYVKLYVWRLRQKIEPDPTKPRYIRTERGLGYRFVADPAP